MHCEGKLQLRSHNTSYCLIEVVTKADFTVYVVMKLKFIYKSFGNRYTSEPLVRFSF